MGVRMKLVVKMYVPGKGEIPVFADKPIQHVENQRVFFEDGSYCDVVTSEYESKGTQIRIGEPGDSVMYDTIELTEVCKVSFVSVVADVILLATDEKTLSYDVEGDDVFISHLREDFEEGHLEVSDKHFQFEKFFNDEEVGCKDCGCCEDLFGDVGKMMGGILDGIPDAFKVIHRDVSKMIGIPLPEGRPTITMHVPRGVEVEVTNLVGNLKIETGVVASVNNQYGLFKKM